MARQLVDERPLALCLDIDEIRVRLGQWETLNESKQVARELGFDITASHLRRGFDVVMPQLTVLGEGMIDRLAQVAADSGATFYEIVLVANPDELLQRLGDDADHPRNAFTPEELRGQMEHCLGVLPALAAERPFAHVLDVSGLDELAALDAVRALVG